MKLDGKVALVTGTSPNIGGGICERLAAAGAALVCVDSRAENAADCARFINANNGRAVSVTCDVTDERQVIAAVDSARKALGGIDILVNNAAIFNRKGVIDMPLDEWQRQISIILTGTFLFTKSVAKLMIDQRRKGSIINIISTAGHQGEPSNIAYCTAKAGLLNFTRSAAMELGVFRTRCAMGSESAQFRAASAGLRTVPKTHPDWQAARSDGLWKRHRISCLRRCRNDHWNRSPRRCGRGCALLGVGSFRGKKDRRRKEINGCAQKLER